MTKEEGKALNETLGRLSRNKDFIEYLKILREMREAAIEGMEGAGTEKLHQIAGCITTYNAILGNAKVYAALARAEQKQ
jgi:hypothetical protein